MNDINKKIYDIILLESHISNEIDNNNKIMLLNKLLKKITLLNNITEKYKTYVEEEIFNNCPHVFENHYERNERTKLICNLCNMINY